ncbi:MAG TPA: endopeptidase La, partial [Acidobacteria bacterium]|nr:endopeptidase La [Acidobacteriota bacterium]
TRLEVGPEEVERLLGKPRYRRQTAEERAEVGAAVGLAWTEVGGEILTTEASLMRGSGKVTLTGQLGDVMQESARAALTFVRSRAEQLGIDPEVFGNIDVHVHVPEGAIPKDGPSAGITMASALVSAFSGRPVRADLAMTGEITLRGRVLPVGGIKEKVLAAFRAGIREVILPEENEKDLEEIPAEVADVMRFTLVKHMDQVLEVALLEAGAPPLAPAAAEDEGARQRSMPH